MSKKYLYLRELPAKGRGVFCSDDIAVGDTIEICPVIVVPYNDVDQLLSTVLLHYCFYFNQEENTLSLVMGFGSMYNHRQYPNAVFILNREQQQMVFTAREHIAAHTEICINYGGNYGDDYSKWFIDRGIQLL